MGHKISKEQIDPGVKDHIMSFVGDVADLETEVNTDIISAVNSLMVDRVDNAENMGKLANAIGEPVTANHSVDEVVEGLGEMLSTFKTNMMNSGVTVESSDKFKQLIDKIKGLTEGEGNKGIQYAEGVYTHGRTDGEVIVPINLSFTPTLILVLTSVQGYSMIYSNQPITNLSYTQWQLAGDNTIARQYKVIEISKEQFKLSSGVYRGNITWYAIGVGEEDTTLRDSLASILQGEGVSVTEEDDMASLINKVDEEFSDKENEISNLETELAGKVTPAGTATAENVLSGQTFINSTGQLVTGNMANRGGAQTVTPGTSNKTLNAGYYSGNITIAGDADLKAANIKSGVSIFGVTGTMKVGKVVTEGKKYSFISYTHTYNSDTDPYFTNGLQYTSPQACVAGTYKITFEYRQDTTGTGYVKTSKGTTVWTATSTGGATSRTYTVDVYLDVGDTLSFYRRDNTGNKNYFRSVTCTFDLTVE